MIKLRYILAFIFLLPSMGWSQNNVGDTIQDGIKVLSEELVQIRKNIKNLEIQKKRTEAKLDSVNKLVVNQSEMNNTATTFLKQQLEEVKGSLEKTESDLKKNQIEINSGLNELKNMRYWFYGVLVLIILLTVLFLFNTKQFKNQFNDLQSLINLNSQKTNKQLISLGQTRQEQETADANHQDSVVNTGVEDHDLILKVADEIVRLERNITRMDQGTKGLKQLMASLKRLHDNLSVKNYELINMLNMPYDEGTNAIVTFKPDDSLEIGQQIVTRIIKPQVNYNGVMIQAAQLEVSQNI